MAQVIIVSGGSRGLGLGLVEGLLDATDAVVATFSRTCTEPLRTLMADPALAGRFYFASADMGDTASLKAFVDSVYKRFGTIDVLINNAGVARDGVLPTFPDADIDTVIDINLKGLMKLTRLAVRYMVRQRNGRVINISSIVGKTGYSGLSVYSAAKAGIDGFTRSLARELGVRGILVNSIAPGYLRTEMVHGLSESQLAQIVRRTPAGRLGEVRDILPLTIFLCSAGAGFITGHTFVVDGGLTA